MNNLLRSVALLIALLSTSHAFSERLTFAFAEDSPPVSSSINGEPVGILPDLVKAVFRLMPEYEINFDSYPWARAQLLVEAGKVDGFMTYPSSKRKEYAFFTDEPGFIQDYGYLIYRKDSLYRTQIEESRRFEDLRELTVIVENGSEWEEDNIPKFLKKVKGLDQDMMIHLLCLRKEGDVIVMPPEYAKYHAKKFGYEKELAYHPVKYINDSLIPFHIGLSKKHDKAVLIMDRINKVINSQEFKDEQQKVVDRYR